MRTTVCENRTVCMGLPGREGCRGRCLPALLAWQPPLPPPVEAELRERVRNVLLSSRAEVVLGRG